ncbi:CHC2 zinc finger domain-containing protein [Prauserella endophytica]|uniref:Zinc finger CHC2-type domain-containing protein n=1 Tax=Prauserella endophytica TaxID=1592324 RepID=A0ABY2RRT3_9PSEU|nr:CHC2 zinc finger domain-containing protein [Prauserella endophytica]TKG57562.1 hypothetical protein FCN18_38860 [Prauserella endophytica]
MTTATATPDPSHGSDILAVVARHVVLREHAPGQWSGRCPFCSSTTFRVRPAHGTYHCFGCGEGGTAPTFTARIQHH